MQASVDLMAILVRDLSSAHLYGAIVCGLCCWRITFVGRLYQLTESGFGSGTVYHDSHPSLM